MYLFKFVDKQLQVNGDLIRRVRPVFENKIID